jgi:hypothetical protein
MSQTNDLPVTDEERLDTNSLPNDADVAGDEEALESDDGVGIGADDVPNTFEPEEDPA